MGERETYSTKGAECPHCGHLNDPDNDNWQLYSEDTDEWECGICSEPFIVSVHTSYSWTCRPKDEDEE